MLDDFKVSYSAIDDNIAQVNRKRESGKPIYEFPRHRETRYRQETYTYTVQDPACVKQKLGAVAGAGKALARLSCN